MTLREELAKMKAEMDEEELWRAQNNLHPPTTSLPRDCRLEESEDVGQAGKQKCGKPSYE